MTVNIPHNSRVSNTRLCVCVDQLSQPLHTPRAVNGHQMFHALQLHTFRSQGKERKEENAWIDSINVLKKHSTKHLRKNTRRVCILPFIVVKLRYAVPLPVKGSTS